MGAYGLGYLKCLLSVFVSKYNSVSAGTLPCSLHHMLSNISTKDQVITFSTAFNMPADNHTNKKNLQTKTHRLFKKTNQA